MMDPHSEELHRSKQSIMKVNRQTRSDSRRKPRKLLSCLPCRKRKVKCNRTKPCNQCIRSKVIDACDYSSSPPPVCSSPLLESHSSVSTQQDESLHPDPPWAGPTLDQPDGRLTSTRHGGVGGSAFHSLPLLLDSTALSHKAPPALPEALSQRENNPSSFRGKQQRTRFFGRSHWATTLHMFPDLMDHIHRYQQAKKAPSASQFHEYLLLTQHKRGQNHVTKHCVQNSSSQRQAQFIDLLPSRQLADYLIHLYFSTYETTLRVVHVPSFLQEWTTFWNARSEPSDRSCSTEILLAKALSMMACASCLADDTSLVAVGSDRSSLSQASHEWVQAVALWLGFIPDHARLNLHVMQVKCLLLTARQATALDGDLVGMTAGSLIREAIMMGLHRDPTHFPNMTPFWAETRKRLWFTVVELELQTSLHLGIPLALSWDDVDCPPPLNVEDEDFSHDSTCMAPEQELLIPTRMTFQVVLAQSLPVRMEIARLVNRVRFTANANEIMRLSDSLASSLAEAPTQMRDDPGSGETSDEPGRCAAFQRSFYLFLMWRSMLALHRPVLLNLADVEGIYSMSRAHCVQASVALLAQLDYLPGISGNVSAPPSGIFHPHVLSLKGGLFQDDIFHAAITACFELRMQLKDSKVPLPTGPISNLVNQSALYHRMALLQSIENALKYFEHKVRSEARACKSYTTLCILYISIKSQLPSSLAPATGGDEHSPQKILTVDEACPLASRRCLNLLLEGDALHSEQIPNQKGSKEGLPLDNPISAGIAPLNVPFDANALANMSGMDMGGSLNLGFEDVDFDWTMLLDPLPPYPIEGWPSTDPLL